MEGITILIVDDAKFMRKKLRDILESGGFTVSGEAEDGEQALEMVKALKPDIVTMDITMPRMDGITAVEAIREVCPESKVIMISALGQKEKVKDSIKAGAVSFILKPFDPDSVLETINSVVPK